ncbi:MAG: flavodoxin [Syntrophobacteraceae bacterium]
MADNKKTARFDASKRAILKYVLPGLAAGLAAPGILGRSAIHAAGPALKGKKVLTAYYSRTGNTRTMASYIHEMVGGDIFEIQTVNPYPDEYEATTEQAKKELESGLKPPLKARVADMASYDVVFIGSPCWWGTICSPVISFLSDYDLSGKVLAPFMTHEGSGLGRTMSHVKEICPNATVVQGHAIRGGSIGSSRNETAGWLRELGLV